MKDIILIKKSKDKKIEAVIIKSSGQIKKIYGETHIIGYILVRLFNSKVNLNSDRDLRFAVSNNLNIVLSNLVLEENKQFIIKINNIYESKLDTKFNDNLIEFHSKYTNQQLIKYSEKANKKKRKYNKYFYRKMLIFSMVPVIAIGSNKINDMLSNETENDEKEDKVVTEIYYQNAEEIKEDTINIIPRNELIETGLNITAKTNVKNFLETDYGKLIIDACDKYDCDLATVLAIGINEYSLDSNNFYIKYADGTSLFNPFNITSMDGTVFFPGTDNEIVRNYNTISNPETHFDLAVANIKHLMIKYNNNPNLYTAAYNMGVGVTDIVIAKIMEENNMTYEDVLCCYNYDIFATEYKEIEKNFKTYYEQCSENVQTNNKSAFLYLENWTYNRYGDGLYLEKYYKYYYEEYGNLFVEEQTKTR